MIIVIVMVIKSHILEKSKFQVDTSEKSNAFSHEAA